MAIPTYRNHVDFKGNEIRSASKEKVASLPASPFDTQEVVDQTNAVHAARIFVNGVWRTVLLGDAGSNGTGLTDLDVTATTALTKSGTGSTLALAIADAVSGTSGLLTGSHFDLLTGSTAAATNGTLVLRDGTGGIAVSTIAMTSGTITTAPSGVNDIVNKTYVDTLVASGTAAINDFDASANPNYPSAAKGDLYHVTVAGRVGGISGEVVEVGDSFKAKVVTVTGDQATVGTNWIVMQNNLDAASTTVSGHSRFATQAEVDAGTLTNVAVSPATMASAGNSGIVNGLIGDGSATSIAFTHNLGNQFCIVQLYDAATNAEVQAGVTLTDANTATIDFSVAPAANEFRVIVTG